MVLRWQDSSSQRSDSNCPLSLLPRVEAASQMLGRLKLFIVALGKRAREDMAEAGEILENAQMSDIYRARAKQRNRI